MEWELNVKDLKSPGSGKLRKSYILCRRSLSAIRSDDLVGSKIKVGWAYEKRRSRGPRRSKRSFLGVLGRFWGSKETKKVKNIILGSFLGGRTTKVRFWSGKVVEGVRGVKKVVFGGKQ